MNDRLLSLREVADYLSIPPGTLYQWRHRGEGPRGFKVGRHVRYHVQDVQAWLEQQRDPEPA